MKPAEMTIDQLIEVVGSWGCTLTFTVTPNGRVQTNVSWRETSHVGNVHASMDEAITDVLDTIQEFVRQTVIVIEDQI